MYTNGSKLEKTCFLGTYSEYDRKITLSPLVFDCSYGYFLLYNASRAFKILLCLWKIDLLTEEIKVSCEEVPDVFH